MERDLAAEEREREPQRPTMIVEHLHGRQPLGQRLHPVLVLEPRPVDPLLEVAPPVEEPDADHRQPAVARRLEDVPREHAEPAGVDRQRPVDPELRADEHHGAVQALDARLGAPAILVEDAREACDPLARGWVADRA